ncbi:hypothetical protein BDB01DRAFT_804775 [Pilobolus umbonatus]|nr:hypothetical protein BDB01DRAFT_804775 [Pilobolus umbonatus]
MSMNDSDSDTMNYNMDYTSPKSSESNIKIRKKPGRKPNPASPALRKAQNRAAQRAFRERKEKHMRELEIAIKQIRDQRDKLHMENEQLKSASEIMRSENWYLKGIVLTLQLVCFQHNLVIPQHGPYINEHALSVLAQSIPESIATYINVNASNKLPIPSKLFGYKHTMKQRDRYLSTNPIQATKESNGSTSAATHMKDTMCDNTSPTEEHASMATDTIPPLSPVPDHLDRDNDQQIPLPPIMLTDEPITSNLAAVQILRLQLRIQASSVNKDAPEYNIQPTILQLTIPHDPRIDLIPTSHMRDRMILFRDQFDLDDCFRILLSHSVFHGGDPAVAANWQLPPEFFEKYWFLTIDYDLRRTTNKWRRLQGLSELDFSQQEEQKKDDHIPLLEKLKSNDLSVLLGIDFWKIAQETHTPSNQAHISYASSLSSESSIHPPASPTIEEESPSTFEPVRLTDGCSLSYSKPTLSKKMNRHHPYRMEREVPRSEPSDTWADLYLDNNNTDYDAMMNQLVDIGQTC